MTAKQTRGKFYNTTKSLKLNLRKPEWHVCMVYDLRKELSLGTMKMYVKYNDVECNGQPVILYIPCRNIDFTSGENKEKPEVHTADQEVQEMCDDVKIKQFLTFIR